MGAPRGNNLELAFEVVALIENESLPLNKACEKIGIPRGSFYLELNNSKELFDTYTRAREVRADRIFEEILEIADKQGEDVTTDPNTGEPQINHNIVQRNRLQIDARKWVLGKMSSRYADNQKIDVTTNGKDLPSTNTIKVEIVKPIDEDEE
jgi:hypothetical protein